MKRKEIYKVQERFNGAPSTEWHDCYWLHDHENLDNAREDLTYARGEAEHGEKYRIIHEIRKWEFFR